MADLVTVFRTQSPIEAEVVKGLLEAHGIATLVQSDMPRTPFPMTLHELRLSVTPEEAERARGLIDSHREERSGARVIPLGAEFEPLDPDKVVPHAHPGVEFLYVLSGKLALVFGPEEQPLDAGDSAYFPSSRPHGYRRAGDERCTAIVISVP